MWNMRSSASTCASRALPLRRLLRMIRPVEHVAVVVLRDREIVAEIGQPSLTESQQCPADPLHLALVRGRAVTGEHVPRGHLLVGRELSRKRTLQIRRERLGHPPPLPGFMTGAPRRSACPDRVAPPQPPGP